VLTAVLAGVLGSGLLARVLPAGSETRSSPAAPIARPIATRATTEEISSRLDRLVPRLLVEGDVPGLSLAVVRDGRVLWHRAYGQRDASTNAPIDDETVFEAASLSKPVFAYAVLKLVDAGVVDLDTPVVKYLPGDYVDDPRFRAITPRRVLSHTTGFPNWRSGSNLTIHFAPGERFSYSGEGFVYLQKAVERTTGQTLEALMKRLVFGPLGMKTSSYSWEDRFEGCKATGHDAVGGPKPPRRPAEASSASTLHTTTLDYARFLIAILDGEDLRRETFDEMFRPQVRVDEGCSNCVAKKPTGRLSRELAWGLGWGLQNTEDDKSIWHWGDNGSGFQCYVVGYPQERLGVVVFTNGLGGHGIIPDVVEAAIGGRHPAFRWIDYERYDSPARTLYKQILANGTGALARYRESRRTKPEATLTEQQVNRVGYWLLEKKKPGEAVAVFEMNVTDFPESWNAHDSLGEAYAADGQRRRAIESYGKSIALNPDNANGFERLRKLKSEKTAD
jgi:CubicO group peptidase (beta-lactamase class C family)